MQPLWRSIVAEFEVKAKPQSIWTKVLDYVGPSRKLKLQASGTWIWQEASPQGAALGPASAVLVPSTQQAANATLATSGPSGGAGSGSTQPLSPPSSLGSAPGAAQPANASQAADTAALTTAVQLGKCGPDGDIHSPPSSDSLLPDALLGALIGKIGGSSAAIKNATAFVVGSHCVLEISDTTKGPLFLTINDTCSGMQDNSGSIHVSIWEAL
jgi:hypothetical protein